MRVLSFALVAAISGTAVAGLENPLVPDWRGTPGTMFSQWDSFSQAVNAPNFPEAGGGFQLFNFGAGAIIASSGNIYNPAGPLDIHVYSLAPVPVYQAVLNIAWSGTELNAGDVRAFQNGSYFDFTSSELRYQQESPFGGFNETWAFTFDLTGDTGDLAFFFGSDGAHSSLDAVSVDVLMVPAPGALALLGVAGMASRRRRR